MRKEIVREIPTTDKEWSKHKKRKRGKKDHLFGVFLCKGRTSDLGDEKKKKKRPKKNQAQLKSLVSGALGSFLE